VIKLIKCIYSTANNEIRWSYIVPGNQFLDAVNTGSLLMFY